MPLFKIVTKSTFDIYYVVDAESSEQALSAVQDSEYGANYEYAQIHKGEQVLYSHPVSDYEFLQDFRDKNDYLSTWSDDFVLAKINKA